MKAHQYYLNKANRSSKSQRRKWLQRAKKAMRSSGGILEIFVWNGFQVVPAGLWRKRNSPSAKISISINPPAARDAVVAK